MKEIRLWLMSMLAIGLLMACGGQTPAAPAVESQIITDDGPTPLPSSDAPTVAPTAARCV